MKKLLLFLVLIISTTISCKQKKTSKKTTDFSITDNGVNNINLLECITIDSLQAAFPSYTITSKVGQQDGPDYRYFEVLKDNTTLNFIMNEQKTCIINEINAQTNLEDMYGVKVGMTYEEVKKLRPNISHKTDFHFHTTLSEPNSNLQYEISGTYNGPDKQDFIYEEVKKWKVVQFIIREH
ncbi:MULTISPECIES: DUF1131 family protein [unclassified Tenacibaculum]|uniref:DUF1131 family protein n=1 Tax=unclassified Tenacibaculum TaxID=2635139 RepID=UPI001F16E299|nr:MULTISPECIES: DUF1131 family protein [unclassified Tenacibaculum]MCF2875355.1 DUF1131 family protein [Tenacibaculum sp. Cn5-1]MCF2935431.1 DUF1131 family protein [Tenacibaculum sp. Cn5-34]MCG7511991.1 DUF1131 family protein [Tenacibaculum sp. Cn5-46]